MGDGKIKTLKRCNRCWRKRDLVFLKSETKGKIIKFCESCFDEKGQNLINGHGYKIINKTK